MTKPQLLPKAPKRKRQPTAACMREQLTMAADEIIALRTALAQAWFEKFSPQPWWRRIFRKS